MDAPVYSLPPRYCTFDTRPTIVVTYSPCLTYSDLGCLAAFEATSLPGVRVHLFEAEAIYGEVSGMARKGLPQDGT